MANAHFGLRDNPFRLTPDLAVRCDWASFAEARRRLAAVLREGRKALLSGETGVGKTLLLRSLAQELAAEGATYVACAPRFSLPDLARALDGAEPAILLIDDAQGLDAAALDALLHRPGALALAGPPSFAQRRLERIDLDPLAPEEVGPYVAGRLEAAGWRGGALFEEAALARLHQLSRGAPRRINNLCSAALFLASQRKAQTVDATLIDEAAAGLSLEAPPPVAAPRRRASPPPLATPAGSPIIVSAFMRERRAEPANEPPPVAPEAQPPEPADEPAPSEPVAIAPPEPVAAPPEPVAAQPEPPPAPPVDRTPPPAPPEPPPLLRPVDRILKAQPESRLTEPEPAPKKRRVGAAMGAVAVSLVVLAGAGAAWRFELFPAALQIDWTRVESIMSPRAATAEAAPGPGPTVALVAAEAPAADDAEANAEPVVFPNSAAPAEAPAPQLAAAPAEAPAPAAAPPPPEVAAPQPTEPAPPAPATADAPPPAPPEAAAREETAPAPQQSEAAPPAPALAALPPSAPAPRAEPAEPPQAAPPAPSKEERIAELLARARRQALSFALTTPPGQSAFDSYSEILAIEPRRPEALAGLDEIAAKYDDLAGLARQRDKPALVQLYETRAAQVRRDRARFAAEGAPAAAR